MRLGGRHARQQRAVDQQAPDLLERHVADELLDVDAAVAQRAALAVGLGDLGGEGDDALEAGLDFGGCAHLIVLLGGGSRVEYHRLVDGHCAIGSAAVSDA